jgi:hypothetical protein
VVWREGSPNPTVVTLYELAQALEVSYVERVRIDEPRQD